MSNSIESVHTVQSVHTIQVSLYGYTCIDNTNSTNSTNSTIWRTDVNTFTYPFVDTAFLSSQCIYSRTHAHWVVLYILNQRAVYQYRTKYRIQ